MLALRKSRALTTLSRTASRHFGASAVGLQKVDPIKQAFADKVREFSQKQKALGDQKLVDATAEVNKAYQDEMERVHRSYQVKSQDEFLKFPSLQYEEPKLEPIDLHDPKPEDNLRW